jgi:hypothetical protein
MSMSIEIIKRFAFWTKPDLAEALGCSYTNIESKLASMGLKLRNTRKKVRGGRGAPPKLYLVVQK